MSVDPSMRGRLDLGEKHYTTNFEIGEPLDGSAIGVVIASESSDGRRSAPYVRHRAGWREHAVVDAATVAVVDVEAAPVGAWLGVLGQTGFTAWVGLEADRRAARGRHGVRLGRRRGGRLRRRPVRQAARRVAGGRQRRRSRQGRGSSWPSSATTTPWTTGPKRPRGVARMAPDGIDVYFDNVGGPQLVAALKNMTVGGRVALCGMISQYSDDGRGEDINHLIEAVLRRVTIRGFIVRDHEDMRPEFERTVAGWLRSGEVEALQTVTDGIDHAVDGFLEMLKGGNVGKALVRLDTDHEI